MIVCIGFFDCSNAGKSGSSPTNVKQDSTEQWNIISKGTQCLIDETSNYLIKTTGDFEKEWTRAFDGMDMPPEKPEVDFTKSWVIAGYMGEKSNGGFQMDIDSIINKNDTLIITIKHIQPGVNCISSMAIEYPYMFTVIDKSSAVNTDFIIVTEIKDCK